MTRICRAPVGVGAGGLGPRGPGPGGRSIFHLEVPRPRTVRRDGRRPDRRAVGRLGPGPPAGVTSHGTAVTVRLTRSSAHEPPESLAAPALSTRLSGLGHELGRAVPGPHHDSDRRRPGPARVPGPPAADTPTHCMAGRAIASVIGSPWQGPGRAAVQWTRPPGPAAAAWAGHPGRTGRPGPAHSLAAAGASPSPRRRRTWSLAEHSVTGPSHA